MNKISYLFYKMSLKGLFFYFELIVLRACQFSNFYAFFLLENGPLYELLMGLEKISFFISKRGLK
jgi:hypothetical protein